MLYFLLLPLLLATTTAGALDLKGKTTVRDQCDSPTCWLQSAMTATDILAIEKYGRDLNFHADNLIMHDLRSRALAQFLGHRHPLNKGGITARALALALEHGLIPASEWSPKSSLAEDYFKAVDYAKTLINHYKNQPKTKTNQKIFLSELDRWFEERLGQVPQTIRFEGREISPTELAKDLLGGVVIVYTKNKSSNSTQVTTKGRLSTSSFAKDRIISRKNNLILIDRFVKMERKSIDATKKYLELIESFNQHPKPIIISYVTRNEMRQEVFFKERRQNKATIVYAQDGRVSRYTFGHATVAVEMNPSGIEVQNSHGYENGTSNLFLDRPFVENHVIAFREIVPAWRKCKEHLKPIF